MFNEPSGQQRLDSTELQMFTGHLSLLVSCGFPLLQILEVLAQGEGGFPHVCRRLATDIFSGHSLSEAMAYQPDTFAENYIHVIRVGETSGRLGECLNRLSVTLEQRNRLKSFLFQLLFYPVTLVVVCLLLTAFAVYGIFPMIIRVTADANVDLPWITKALLAITSPTALMLMTFTTFLLVGSVVAILRTPRYGRRVKSFWETWTPLGRFQVQTRLVMSLRQLALLMECGIDLLRSLRLLRDVAGSSILLKDAFFHMNMGVQEGKTLADGFADHDVFPAFVKSMVAAGEESASTHVMLNRAADVMEEDLYRRARTLAALAEPIIIGFLGLGVGTVLLATLLPIYKMVNF